MFCSAVVVDLDFLNPCWWVAKSIESEMVGSRTASSILARGDSRDIGLKLDPLSAGLPGFNKGIRPITPTKVRGSKFKSIES